MNFSLGGGSFDGAADFILKSEPDGLALIQMHIYQLAQPMLYEMVILATISQHINLMTIQNVKVTEHPISIGPSVPVICNSPHNNLTYVKIHTL